MEYALKWDEIFITKVVHNAMELDALESSHPISVPVNHPNEISEIFDRISYEKGMILPNESPRTKFTHSPNRGIADSNAGGNDRS